MTTAAKRAPSKAAATRRAAMTWPEAASSARGKLIDAIDEALKSERVLDVTIPGPPVSKGRPRASIIRSKGKARIVMRTPEETERYEAHVRELFEYACMAHGWPPGGWPSPSVRYVVDAEFILAADVEDADNLVKAQLDAANKVLFPDDRRVCLMLVARRVAAVGEAPQAKLRVWAMGPTTEAP